MTIIYSQNFDGTTVGALPSHGLDAHRFVRLGGKQFGFRLVA